MGKRGPLSSANDLQTESLSGPVCFSHVFVAARQLSETSTATSSGALVVCCH